jgi:hypothetical protein
MELKDFVAQALTQIAEGVVQAQTTLDPLGAKVKWSNHSGHPVKVINYPNEVNNESRETNPKTI